MHLLPASWFSVVLGLTGLGNAWRVAHRVWGLPPAVGEALHLVAGLIWAWLAAAYVGKWLRAPAAARAELEHPVQCCFVGLAGVSTLLVAGGALPHSRPLAGVLFVVGLVVTLGFAVWRTGGLWQGGRDPSTITAVLYLPTAAGSFVAATVAAAFGLAGWAPLLFGAGILSVLAIESVLLHRLMTAPALAGPLRPTLGITLAPPTVGGVAYLAVSQRADVIASVFLGYGLLQAAVLLRLLPWIRKEPFGMSYWAFSFGASALATLPLRMVEEGATGAAAALAPVLFVLANLAIGALAAGTVALALRGRLLPAPAPEPAAHK
jgi:tellurite resistance protein